MTTFGKALDKGLDILEALQKSRQPLAFGELKDMVEVSPASFTRFLKMLQDRGYVLQAKDGRYYLGWRSVQLGLTAREASVMYQIAGPHIEEISEEFEETVELVAFYKGRFIFLDRATCPRGVSRESGPGTGFYYSDYNAIGLLALTMGLGKKAPRDRRRDAIRKRRFAEKVGKDEVTYRAAAAIMDRHAKCVGAFSLAAPVSRASKKRKAQFRDVLTHHAAQVSREMGFRGTGEL